MLNSDTSVASKQDINLALNATQGHKRGILAYSFEIQFKWTMFLHRQLILNNVLQVYRISCDPILIIGVMYIFSGK